MERANPYYAWAQSLRSSSRAEAWRNTFESMLEGRIQVGSRAPVADLPVWVTLEVLPGGFTTGKALAGGPLQPFEEELALECDLDPDQVSRLQLNAHFLSSEGQARLEQWLENGHYRLELAEEGALLTVAWLLKQENEEGAMDILEAITPYLDRLRFYPRPAGQPLPDGPEVFLRSVEELRFRLNGLQTPRNIEIEREALTVWQPFYDKVSELLAETQSGQPAWPFQTFPDGWRERAQSLREEYRQLRKQHRLCHRRPKGNRRHLLEALQVAATDPGQLRARQVGMVARVLRDIEAHRGVPLRPECQVERERAREIILRPSPGDLKQVLLERLKDQPGDQGLIAPESWLHPTLPEEVASLEIPAGEALPDKFRQLLTPCRIAPLGQLIEEGILPSADVLARVLPRLTGQLQARLFVEPALQRLYACLYRAFRRRRSLLLLNLEHQVRFHELPWVAALQSLPANPDSRIAALRALCETVSLILRRWPQYPFPNKLLQELEALARLAELKIPVVEELAADIFMGRFSAKFARAANLATEFLKGRLYQQYYDLPLVGSFSEKSFGELCMARAGVSGRSFHPSVNGTVLEQAQILTTHNLATFCHELKIELSAELPRSCYQWILAELKKPAPDRHTRRIRQKNCATAWRQMVFFLSFQESSEIQHFLDWAGQQPLPYLEGLRQAAAGQKPLKIWLGWEA